MTQDYIASAKVYPTENLGKMSILDMLAYFVEKGAMRVSDLHLKVGVPPTYRIDGNLIKLKGAVVTPEMANQLIIPLLKGEKTDKLDQGKSIDCSYRYGDLQFRINVFRDNDGLATAIRALSLDIPDVENVGFPNTYGRTSSIANMDSYFSQGLPGLASPRPLPHSSNDLAKNEPTGSSPLKTPLNTFCPRSTRLFLNERSGATSTPSARDSRR